MCNWMLDLIQTNNQELMIQLKKKKNCYACVYDVRRTYNYYVLVRHSTPGTLIFFNCI